MISRSDTSEDGNSRVSLSCTSTDNVQTPSVSDPYNNCAGKGQGKEENVAPFPLGPSTHTDDSKELIIAAIRAVNVTLGLRRLPAGFYAVVHHDGLEWRTENKRSSVYDDIVEWSGPIPIPSDPSAIIRLEVYASFEFQPMLGAGEQLRELTIAVGQLLDGGAKGDHEWDAVLPLSLGTHTEAAFTFFPKDGDVVSPCSSISVTISRQNCSNDSSSESTVRGPHRSTTESRGDLEDTTNQGHSALSRYRKHGEQHDLERSIEAFEQAHRICQPDHPCHAIAQSNLAMAKFILCQVQGTNAFLEVPLSLYRNALDLRPVGHVDRPSTLIQLAAVHFARFENWRDEFEAAQAEALLHEAKELCSAESHESQVAIFMLQLHTRRRVTPVQVDGQPPVVQRRSSASRTVVEDPLVLSDRLLEHFERFGDLTDLHQAISILEEFVTSTSVSDGHDLEEAISRHKEAANLTTNGHPEKPGRLNNVANAFKARFKRLGKLSDLENAIATLRNAVDLTPRRHPHKLTLLNSLGACLRARFGRLGELGDLENAISTLVCAVDLTPHDHPDKPGRLNHLGNAFKTRFERLGELSDLEKAIVTLRDAAELTPNDHPEKPVRLNSLGNAFFDRFERFGELGDLEGAISTLRDAVHLTPQSHSSKPARLSNLANALKARFKRFGELSDLEDAISIRRDAVDLTPDGHPDKATLFNNLGNCFKVRFERLRQLSDLDDAIYMLKRAVELTRDGHSTHYFNLGNSLLIRFERLGEQDDLEQAISMFRDAVALSPNDHPRKSTLLSSLGVSLKDRFDRLGKLEDLEDAISTHKNAVDLTPYDRPDKPARLFNLGSSLRARFDRIGQLSDLEQAISMYRDTVDLTPDDHPRKLTFVYCLGNNLWTRFERLEDPNDVEHVISLFSRVAFTSVGPIIVRFRTAQNWIFCARRIRHSSLLQAYSVAVTLLPQLAWIGLPLTQRYHELKIGADVVREAAAAALDSGLLETAVEWLEQGRSIVWGELFQLHSSHEELSSAYPEHARRLQELSAALEHAGATREKSLSSLLEESEDMAGRTTLSLQGEADRHRTLAIKRDKLLKEIRSLPGFDRFLLHKQFSQLRAAAHSGPVVILNAAKSRCDALIIRAEVDHIIHVPLPNLTFKRSEGLQNMLEKLLGHTRVIRHDEREGKSVIPPSISWEFLLSTLWKDVVKPILDTLEFSTHGDISRMFWCPTGPFVFLPIHAAGLYDTDHSKPGHKVSDFVISSYIPTLSILALSANPIAVPSGDLRLLAVRQPSSDGLSQLPGVDTELEHIRTVIRNSLSAQTTLVESSIGTVEEVLSLMKDADWVHFACHGIQDAASPTDSGLCLADQRRLKLRDIIALSRPNGGLAFLSACQTATGDEGLSDEAIHIAAGMLFAGYGGVIGTMWSISDKIAPEIARDVYTQLFRNGTRPDYREAARALHGAIERLRESGRAPFATWLPFIHVGL